MNLSVPDAEPPWWKTWETPTCWLPEEPWPSLRLRYIRAMEQLHLLHSCPFPEEFPLQPAFDEALYRWEQSYFAEHFLGSHLGLEPASFLNHPALKEQAQFLSALPECPVHRDSQSQNVHIHAGKPG